MRLEKQVSLVYNPLVSFAQYYETQNLYEKGNPKEKHILKYKDRDCRRSYNTNKKKLETKNCSELTKLNKLN